MADGADVMENETGTALDHKRATPAASLRRTFIDPVRLYLGYLLLAACCFGFSLLALTLFVLLPRARSRRVGRKLVARLFRFYLRLLELMGACRFDLAALDALRGGPALIIAPNHPSLLDAVMILSRLPDAACIMKTDIVNSVFFGAGARLAGYICNTPLRTMVQSAVADLGRGSHLLLFPEGTRTSRHPVGAMQGTAGLIAKHAGVPVQTVFIETDSGFLGKGWSVLWTPSMPISYRVRLGKRFDPPRQAAHFAGELERYFQTEMAHARLPEFPISAPD